MPIRRPVLRAAVVGLLVLGLSGCTDVAPPGVDSKPPAGEPGSDLGNGRPSVTFDGPMVRRRVVVAIHPRAPEDLVALRGRLDQAAGRLRLSLTDISPTVLDADVLDTLAPELIVALPAGATVDEAGRLIDLVSSFGGADGVRFHIGPVLVHDLRFTLRTDDPQELQDSIDREGILTDALGAYDASTSDGELRIDYTGPLLSDDLVRAIRAGIARPAHAGTDDVTVSPRTAGGVGVQMETEPAPGEASSPPAHGHIPG